MYMSGVRIGMVATRAIRRTIRQEQAQAATAFCVAAVGTAARGTCECRIAATTRPTTATTCAVSALLFKFTAW